MVPELDEAKRLADLLRIVIRNCAEPLVDHFDPVVGANGQRLIELADALDRGYGQTFEQKFLAVFGLEVPDNRVELSWQCDSAEDRMIERAERKRRRTRNKDSSGS
jgi:hypothetical protein